MRACMRTHIVLQNSQKVPHCTNSPTIHQTRVATSSSKPTGAVMKGSSLLTILANILLVHSIHLAYFCWHVWAFSKSLCGCKPTSQSAMWMMVGFRNQWDQEIMGWMPNFSCLQDLSNLLGLPKNENKTPHFQF